MSMTICPTNCGTPIPVDDEDYDRLNKTNWQFIDNRVFRLSPFGRIYMAREIMKYHGYDIEGKDIDHEDRNGANNQKYNLRIATKSQNGINQVLRKNNTTGFKGVTYEKYTNKYKAQIWFENVCIHLGRFDDPEEAALAYDRAARRYHGKFARLNFPLEGENSARE